MKGKGCVAIACDLRLGNQALTVACNFEKVQLSRRFTLKPSQTLTHACACLALIIIRSSQLRPVPTLACPAWLQTRSQCSCATLGTLVSEVMITDSVDL